MGFLSRGNPLKDVTRVTVVTDVGREFEKFNAYADGVSILVQDDGRTLKIIPRRLEDGGD